MKPIEPVVTIFINLNFKSVKISHSLYDTHSVYYLKATICYNQCNYWYFEVLCVLLNLSLLWYIYTIYT